MGIMVLYPDNQKILMGNSYKEASNKFTFEEEAVKVPYISSMQDTYKGSKYIYIALPIEKDGDTTGILFGFINLQLLSQTYKTAAFDGNTDVFVIDADTGDYIINTRNENLGNIYDEDIFHNPKEAGYGLGFTGSEMLSGKEGYFEYFSQSSNQYFYSFYKPIGINNWMVQVSAPEKTVFSGRAKILRVIMFLTVAISILCICIFIKVVRDSKQKEKELEKTTYMYDIQETLFDAYKNPNCINLALKKVAEMIKSEAAFLITLENDVVEDVYFYNNEYTSKKKVPAKDNLDIWINQTKERLRNGKSWVIYRKSKRITKAETEFLNEYLIDSIMLVPVINHSGQIIALLGVSNMEVIWQNASHLKSISHNFLMAVQNIHSYNIIRHMGLSDALTGLKNRNCYQHEIKEIEKHKGSICCIYIDANGLHDLNNTLGHEAGDNMLKFVANEVKKTFGNDSYRTGGDEFVAFLKDTDIEQIKAKIENFRQKITEVGYNASIGYAVNDEEAYIDRLIEKAEERMYADKAMYYKQFKHENKKREMNRTLEKILLEKRYADNVIDIISSYFLGVYVVDLASDNVTTLFAPPIFAEVLEIGNNKFTEAINKYYINSLVAQKYRPEFARFADKNTIHQQLLNRIVPEIEYERTDGTKIRIRVYGGEKYSNENKESYWVFEEL
jgi:diguanylate cyclase (GGDEF)-like protein